MVKDRYEISLWEDYLVEATGTGDNLVPAHFEERKVCIIGSDSLTSECRAIEPKLIENINGTHIFTFKMFYVYRENNEVYQNPFLNLLINERKVKVLWKNEWYDFVIKNCQENSGDKSITYTCTDLFINELSKTGFDIILDTELKNNQGTPVELAKVVLEDTDWTVDEEHSDIIKQEKEEPVYKINTLKGFTFDNQTTGGRTTVPQGAEVLIFYQQIQDFLNSDVTSGHYTIQFAYATEYLRDTNSQLVINADCLVYENQLWTLEDDQGTPYVKLGGANGGEPWGKIYYEDGVSEEYRATRLVRSQKSAVDPVTGKCCRIYKLQGHTGEDDDEYYGYQTVEYNDPTTVNNLLINSVNFNGVTGWGCADENPDPEFKWVPYPLVKEQETFVPSTNYLRLAVGYTYYNLGLTQSKNYIPNGFIKGQKYVLRYKVKSGTDNPTGGYKTASNSNITPSIESRINGTIISYFSFESATNGDDNWVERICTCTTSIKKLDLYSKEVKLYLLVGSSTHWLEAIQFFPLYYAENNTRINPEEMDLQSIATTYYVYYNHTQQLQALEEKDIIYSYKDTVPDPQMVAIYNENFEKIRSINAKQSNRFNILQSIAETFECWIRFVIMHDETGGISYDSKGNPQKYVIFKKEIGEEVGVGFVYGIDLKTIQRTIQSDQIVTKTIVSKNSNEFAQNGFCTIARSIENYPRVNFILNFDYYISQGLLNSGELTKDLYVKDGAIGYYYWLNKLNGEYDAITEDLTQKQTELLKQQSFLTVYESTITSTEEEIANIKSEVMAVTGKTTWADAVKYVNTHKTGDTKLTGQVIACSNLEKNLQTYRDMKTKLSTSIATLTSSIETWQDTQKSKIEDIKKKHLEFYTKYSRYIQEGSWISEDYVDDNLYYLDALSVAYTSSRPQISYNISVLRLSALDEFKNKVFHLGDISFIQDTEFFGYTRVNANGISVITPYKEKVLVSEVTSYFDEPEKDSFKVQNYKTQFEDLFQRITSTTQSLQYASGEYSRAASVVDTTGIIKPETLQDSIAVNQQLVISAQNETISWDTTGFSVIDASNPNNQTKITSGGVFITTDGGATWKNAIRGEGLSTQYLTTGNINTEYINIIGGDYATFRWDQNGINAYRFTGPKNNRNYYFNTAVRLDQFGLYGINNYISSESGGSNDASNFTPANENDIWTSPYVRFGLTWKGFFLKNEDSSVEISSENDIVVTDGTYNRVKIGRISGSSPNYIYGIQISNSSGNPVLVTGSDGNLWLKNTIKVGAGSTSTVDIGYNSSMVRENTQYHEVFHAGERGGTNEFVVYEDGYLKASGGTFTGEIYATSGSFTGEITATSGTIGNVQIGDFVSAAYKVVITSNGGTTFKKQSDSTTPSVIVLTATLYKGNQPISNGVTYQWYENNSQMQGKTGQTLTVNGSTFSGDEVKVYRCDVQYSG